MSKKLVIAGISTEVGKTVVSALFAEALSADYWKPIQSGSKTDSDTKTVKQLVSNHKTVYHKESYLLKEPLSPHAAATIDGVEINLDKIIVPETENTLIIELAGGLMVPLNNHQLNIDLLIQWKYPVVLVANFYLGSINHTLLSINILNSYEIPIHSIVFNGPIVESSKEVILKFTQLDQYIELPTIIDLNRNSIKEYAQQIAIRL